MNITHHSAVTGAPVETHYEPAAENVWRQAERGRLKPMGVLSIALFTEYVGVHTVVLLGVGMLLPRPPWLTFRLRCAITDMSAHLRSRTLVRFPGFPMSGRMVYIGRAKIARPSIYSAHLGGVLRNNA